MIKTKIQNLRPLNEAYLLNSGLLILHGHLTGFHHFNGFLNSGKTSNVLMSLRSSSHIFGVNCESTSVPF